MTIAIKTAILHGVEARPVTVRVSARHGTPGLQIVGLTQAQAHETRVRVVSALRSVDCLIWGAVSVELKVDAPVAYTAALDLPIALGAYAHLKGNLALDNLVAAGELALDGTLRPIRGALPIALASLDTDVIVPIGSAREAALAPSRVFGAGDLREAVAHLSGGARIPFAEPLPPTEASAPSMDDVVGQDDVKRALIDAAAQGRPVLLVGPPGTGKTVLARRAVGLLPPVAVKGEMLTLAAVQSAAGLPVRPRVRPFRAPHHTVSLAGLVGHSDHPGELTLAHGGVLYLDELPEFTRAALDAVERAVKQRCVVVNGARMPADFRLVASANPCPCGFAGSTVRRCACTPVEVERYRARFMPWTERLGALIVETRSDQ